MRQEEGMQQSLMTYNPRRRTWTDLTPSLRTPKRLKIRGAAGPWVITHDESIKRPKPMHGTLINTTEGRARPFVAPFKVIVQPVTIGDAFVFSTTGRGAPHTDGLQIFYPATGRWRAVEGTLPDWGTDHRTSALASTRHVLLKFGGEWKGKPHNDGLTLDTRSARWQATPSRGAPSPRAHATVSVRGTNVALWGGTAKPSRRAWELGGAIYDTATRRWSALPNEPALGPFPAQTSTRATLTETHLVLIRGAVVRVLDLRSKRWQQGTIPRQPFDSAVALDNGLVVWSAAKPTLFDPSSMRMCHLPGDSAVDEVLVWTGSEVLRWGGVALTSGGCEDFDPRDGGCDPWTKRTPRLTGEHLRIKRRRGT
ncbi:MAG: hypothetical protein AAF721_21815 [Myxococcota bacterium]